MNSKKMVALIALALPMFAQTPLKETLAKHWKVSADFTVKVAEAMPADSYNFKPVPEELSFGQLMGQIALANAGACANASGMKAPAVPSKVAASRNSADALDKETAIKYLKDTFDFCQQAVESMTPEKLDAPAGSPNRHMNGYEWLWAYFTHTAHHRGQAEVYLRIKGIKPPDYTF